VAAIAVDRNEARTALYDAIIASVELAKTSYDWTTRNTKESDNKHKIARRQVVVIVTDGEDTVSTHTMEEAQEKLRKPDMPAYRTFFVAVKDHMEATGMKKLNELLGSSAHTKTHCTLISAANVKDIPTKFKRVKEQITDLAPVKK